MITRAWLAVSFLWAAGWLSLLLNEGEPLRGNISAWTLVLFPFIIGVLLKLIGRYIVYGSIERRW